MKKKRESVFAYGVCLLLFAVMVIMSLSILLEAATVGKGITSLTAEKERLEEENELLRVKTEMRISLEELDERAREELGMICCRPDQIVYLTLEEDLSNK